MNIDVDLEVLELYRQLTMAELMTPSPTLDDFSRALAELKRPVEIHIEVPILRRWFSRESPHTQSAEVQQLRLELLDMKMALGEAHGETLRERERAERAEKALREK